MWAATPGGHAACARGTALGTSTESSAAGASIIPGMVAHVTPRCCAGLKPSMVGQLLNPHPTVVWHQTPGASWGALSRAPCTRCPLRRAPQLLRNELAPAHRLLSWYVRPEPRMRCLDLLPGLARAGPLPRHGPPSLPSLSPLPVKAAQAAELWCWGKTGAGAKSDRAKWRVGRRRGKHTPASTAAPLAGVSSPPSLEARRKPLCQGHWCAHLHLTACPQPQRHCGRETGWRERFSSPSPCCRAGLQPALLF